MQLRLAILAALAATPLAAEGGPSAGEIDALVAAMAAGGCRMDQDNADAVLEAAGLGTDDAAVALGRLAEEARVDQEIDGAFVLLPPDCAEGEAAESGIDPGTDEEEPEEGAGTATDTGAAADAKEDAPEATSDSDTPDADTSSPDAPANATPGTNPPDISPARTSPDAAAPTGSGG